jgi:ketosteroid isomerase-like protein
MILRMVFQITPGFQWLLAGLTSCVVSIINQCRKGGVMKPKAIKLFALAMTLGAFLLTSVISLGTLGLSLQRQREGAKGAAMAQKQDSTSQEQATRTAIERFNEAFNRHDADALAAFLTEDTVFEDTSPAPDGRQIKGRTDVVAFWREWFGRNPDATFEAEEMIVSGNRAVVLWVYHKMRNGEPWHLRGVDVFTVRDGKVAAKLAYVKG